MILAALLSLETVVPKKKENVVGGVNKKSRSAFPVEYCFSLELFFLQIIGLVYNLSGT